MNKRTLVSITLLAIVLSATSFAPVNAQSATSQTWDSSITYYTPSDTGGTLYISFYAEGSSTPITIDPITLNPHTAGSLYVGGVSELGTSFAGSAVLSSEVYVVATYVQFAAGSANSEYGRLLYSGFNQSEAASTFYVPTVLHKKFGSTSLVSIQNIEDFAATVNVKFYAVGETTPTVNKDYDVPAQSTVLLPAQDASKVGLPEGFTGSAVITAHKQGDPATPARVVASAQETDDNGRGAYAFEGLGSGSNTVYMPSMQCKAFSDQQISYYAIQNASLTENASVSIDFYDVNGTKIANMPSTNVGPGGKISVNPCSYGVNDGQYGSAVINSTGAPVIAIGKVKSSNGVATAFVGQASGATKIAAPYIRWAATPSSEWRSYVAIMNVGSGDATDIKCMYYDGNGTLQATHTIANAGNPLPRFIKRNTNAYDAGALQSNGTFGLPTGGVPGGGSIECTSDQDIVVLVRAQRDVSLGATTRFAEDYNGVSIP